VSVVWQASCVVIAGRAVLIEGPPGSGKSSLALAGLIGDDAVALQPAGGRLFASPPPNVAGLIEVRNVGLLRRPVAEPAPVALVLVLDRDAPRFIERAGRCERAGVRVPMVRLWPDSPVLALRAQAALELHGLP